MEKRIKILRAGIWWEFAHYRKAPKTAQNGWRRAGVVPNPEFTPRNTTTGVFEFWRLAGPKETRSGNFYSLFHSPVGRGYPAQPRTRESPRTSARTKMYSQLWYRLVKHWYRHFDLVLNFARVCSPRSFSAGPDMIYCSLRKWAVQMALANGRRRWYKFTNGMPSLVHQPV